MVPRCSVTRTLPWVSTPIATSTWLGSRVDEVQDDPLLTAKPARSSAVSRASPVDVEAGERDQVGEPLDRVAHDLDVGDVAATCARTSSTRGRSRASSAACSAART